MIEIIDPIISRSSRDIFPKIRSLLEYNIEIWINTQFGKRKKIKKVYFTDKNRTFLTGFVDRIKKKLNCEVKDNTYKLEAIAKPKLKNIQFRKDQLYFINKAAQKQRGVILSPTGSGKTILAFGLLSMFPKAKALFLCHSLSILEQTYKKAISFGFDVGFVGGGKVDLSHQLTIASIQTMSKLKIKDYCDKFDITIIDECHRLSSKKGQYYKFMTTNLSPIRIGFTATLPSKKESLLCIEGCLGPIIGELTLKEGIEMGIIATPKVKLLSIKKSARITDFKRYKDIYKEGVVNNNLRNKLIVSYAKKRINENKSVLIIVKEIDHAKNILEIANLLDTKIEFVRGSTDKETREIIKKSFDKKETLCVIATTVWKEGIDIPSLDCIINACGGKSEIATLQMIGRGLRTTKHKTKVEIIDFLDPYRYLAEHTIMRLQLYSQLGWL